MIVVTPPSMSTTMSFVREVELSATSYREDRKGKVNRYHVSRFLRYATLPPGVSMYERGNANLIRFTVSPPTCCSPVTCVWCGGLVVVVVVEVGVEVGR